MSETIIDKDAIEKAAAEQQDYVAKLKESVGKVYLRKDGKELPTTVLGYGGTRIHQEIKNGKPAAVNSHIFIVEASDGRRWTPPATQFLNEHNEIKQENQSA